jgi:small ligand-binding sensory domain FIST
MKLFHRQKRGQFEAESVLGDGQSRTGDIALEDIVRNGRGRNFDVRNRSRTHL